MGRGPQDQEMRLKEGLGFCYEVPRVPCCRFGSSMGPGPRTPTLVCLRIPGSVAGRMEIEALSLTAPQGKRAGQVGLGRRGRLGPPHLHFYQSHSEFLLESSCVPVTKCLSSAKLLRNIETHTHRAKGSNEFTVSKSFNMRTWDCRKILLRRQGNIDGEQVVNRHKQGSKPESPQRRVLTFGPFRRFSAPL